MVSFAFKVVRPSTVCPTWGKLPLVIWRLKEILTNPHIRYAGGSKYDQKNQGDPRCFSLVHVQLQPYSRSVLDASRSFGKLLGRAILGIPPQTGPPILGYGWVSV